MDNTKTLSTHSVAEAIPYICQLPTELLQLLLNLSVAESRQGFEPWRVYSRIAELRLVCTRWMAAIDSYPSFWTLLTNRLSPLLVSIVLQKSGTLPLDIDLNCMAYAGATPPFDYINLVIRLAGRWRSLNIRWFPEDEEDEALRNVLLTPAPQLKELVFDGFSGLPSRVSLFDNVAPNLDSIITRRALPNLSSFVMRGLRKLVVLTVVPRAGDFENLVQALAASPNMEELRVREWIPTGGSLPENLPAKPKPIVLDFLHSLTLHVFPPPWANALLEAIQLPRHCSVDIVLEVLTAQAALSEPLKHLRTRLARSPLMNVRLDVRERLVTVGLRCEGTDEVGEVSVILRYPTRPAVHPSDALQLWQRSLAEITEAVQVSGIPVHITMSVYFFPDTYAFEHPMTAALELVDKLLPSVYKVTIAGTHIQQFLEYITFPTFLNLSDLEVLEAQTTLWEMVLECVSARSELSAVTGSKLKALRSIWLPRGFLHDEGFEKLSRVVKNIYTN
ncbi:hypothetical protein M407DRAFT_28381 [Tulasnella calospora MUT 4182]|nr:hypothetical protein M407DRAFT_28381 [Tulasnella calospora MUT 4182]